MQFIPNGPDIPNDLLQAHEEGRVVFFCGAGISYPAGLPGFEALVESIYESLNEEKAPLEESSFQRAQYDVTLDLLERRITGNRLTVRSALKNSLNPDLSLSNATKTHESLIKLGTDNYGSLRIVTTNFDHIFEEAASLLKVEINSYAAPMLPTPKVSRWNGLIYLHGVLPETNDIEAFNRLVITSGDFGLAYLTERWASRFVSELFRNFVVCFVGYSINDPVLRYMMDALAADRMLGENTALSYAFGTYDGAANKDSATEEWSSKGVVPVLFDKNHGRSKLHETLEAWAEMYQDGITGKESIVTQNALATPSSSTVQDDYVGRVIWALSDESGSPAKRFAHLTPTPSLDWLQYFSQNNFKYSDLKMFGINPSPKKDSDIEFSLIHRPSPHFISAKMSLLSQPDSYSQWDSIMSHLGTWISYHLNDPMLLVWFAERGGKLNSNLIHIVENRLKELHKLKGKEDTVSLDKIKKASPNGIPSSLMERLWGLFLNDKVKTIRHWSRMNLYDWADKLKYSGLTPSLRFELREILAPKIQIEKPFRIDKLDCPNSAERISDLVRFELTLAEDHPKSAIKHISDDTLNGVLPLLLNELQQLLLDALDLNSELGTIDEHHDNSFFDLPSISEHFQNKRSRQWTILIELLRDSWLDTYNNDPNKARVIAETWFSLPYPVFKRLAFFAASHENCIPSKIWIHWLTQDNTWWLWTPETKRETMRLISLRGAKTKKYQTVLEEAILKGPPKNNFKLDIDDDESFQKHCDRSIWLLLAKLNQSGAHLGTGAEKKFKKLSDKYPEWKLSKYEQEEFSYWMSGTGDPDYEESQTIDIVPHKLEEIIDWIKHPKKKESPWMYRDNWEETCLKKPCHVLAALSHIASEKEWPIDKWNTALNSWSRNLRIPIKLWKHIYVQFNLMSEKTLINVSHSLGWLLEKLSSSNRIPDEELIQLSERLLNVQENVDDFEFQDDITSQAINHSIGHLTKALINVWFKGKPEDGDLLPERLSKIFTKLTNVKKSPYLLARVVLASQLIALHRVDTNWTRRNLLPLFNWNDYPEEAKAVWQGFLWAPRIYQPLMIELKSNLLATASRYEELDNYDTQFASFLTHLALNKLEGFTDSEFKDAITNLSEKGIQQVVDTLYSAFSSSGDKKESYLVNRVIPFWENIWPKSNQYITQDVSESLAKLCVEAGEYFPTAFTVFQHWIIPVAHPDYVVHRLYETNISKQFPEEALSFLDKLIENQIWRPEELSSCLELIIQSKPNLNTSPAYRRLRAYLQQA
ncbi:anti-phage defense-associated sirtuin Dsr1 [Thiomicrorhabdus sp.]|uniref:anti-phage defense-associated sirtuin Dsr1 n=1 Tax=Thiomicrorhabdus sp. TaxID=2039724 RepID=UPI002AA6B6AB|nr:anti-phage defense-associated sirtuin Dsr1 [Thiomicrorhabdus sp.]